MEISKDDLLTFTKEEKKEIDAALNNVLDDLDELWKHSSKQEVYTYFYMRRSDWDEEMIRLSIDQEGIKLGDDPEYILEQFKKVNKRPKVKNYTAVFYFLKEYDYVRQKIEEKIIKANTRKGKGIQQIIDIKNKYAKEATIEVDLPETMNPHSIELKKENGQTVGEIRMGFGAIRIITKGPITIIKNEEEKVKRK